MDENNQYAFFFFLFQKQLLKIMEVIALKKKGKNQSNRAKEEKSDILFIFVNIM